MQTQNTKQKSQNYNQKAKIDLKQRVYQLLRSGTSIGANVIEAHGSHGRRDFANFFSHALKSANESKYWLGLLRDTGKSRREETDFLLNETIELANILAASLITIRGKKAF